MTNYEVLDLVADSYNRVLGLLWLATMAIAMWQRAWRCTLYRAIFGTALVSVARLLEIADWYSGAFPGAGLDYSSHTAIALGMVVYLAVVWKQHWIWWWTSMACYLGLVLYQRYHTLDDVIVTAIVSAPLIAAFAWAFRKRVVLPGTSVVA